MGHNDQQSQPTQGLAEAIRERLTSGINQDRIVEELIEQHGLDYDYAWQLVADMAHKEGLGKPWKPKSRTSQAPPPTIDYRKNQRIWLIVIGVLVVCVIVITVISNKEAKWAGSAYHSEVGSNLCILLLFFPSVIILLALIWPIHAFKAALAVIALYSITYYTLSLVRDSLDELFIGFVLYCCAIPMPILTAFICGRQLRTMRHRHDGGISTSTS